nr:hypothetical protein [Candidatus Freyarchaeota archaeon]
MYLITQAKRMASELAKLRSVNTVILFGSAAQRNVDEYSNSDMIIVVD